jgi:tripartite-type tricarboxylate transporter receptor subunit TctC
MPNTPTIEAGVPGYDCLSCVAAPAGTPRDIVQRINTALARAMQSQDTAPWSSRAGALAATRPARGLRACRARANAALVREMGTGAE